jgi:hypothetical protein
MLNELIVGIMILSFIGFMAYLLFTKQGRD